MQNTEAQQILLSIIEQAEQENYTLFQFITSWAEFKFYYKKLMSTKLVIRILRTSADNLFNSYCKDIANGTQDVSKLLAYSQLGDIKAFYERDLETVKQMLDEYDEYLGQGNFLYSFLGGERQL